MAAGVCTGTVDADGFSPMNGSNAGYMVHGQIVLSTSYAVGGDTIAASVFGIGRITDMIIQGANVIAAGTNAVVLSPHVATDGSVDKVQAFWSGAATNSVLTQVAANTDLSGYTAQVIVFGT